MSRKQSRRSVTVSRPFMARIEAAAAQRGITPTRLVERAVADLSSVNADDVRDGMRAAQGRTRAGHPSRRT